MKVRGIASAVLTAGLLVGSAGTALAVDGTQEVSCDNGITSSLITLYGGGTMSVKQRDTNPNNNRYYWAVSSNGNSLSWKAAADGGTVSWTSVASSNYTFKTRTVSDQNCNGILPGLGNTTLAWTVNP